MNTDKMKISFLCWIFNNLLTGAFVTDLLSKNIKFNLLTCHFLKLTLNFFGCFLDWQVPDFMQKKIPAVNEYW